MPKAPLKRHQTSSLLAMASCRFNLNGNLASFSFGIQSDTALNHYILLKLQSMIGLVSSPGQYYTQNLMCALQSGNILHSVSKTIAFRRVVIVQDELIDQDGRTFLFEIN